MPAAPAPCSSERVVALVEAIRKNLANHPRVAGIEHDAAKGEVVFTLRGGRRYALADAKFLSLYGSQN